MLQGRQRGLRSENIVQESTIGPRPPTLTHPTLHVRFLPALIVVRFFRKRF